MFMKRFISLAVAVALTAASPKPPSTYDELIRTARDAAGEGLSSVALNGRTQGGDAEQDGEDARHLVPHCFLMPMASTT